jgi:hypothetical protein
VLDSLPASNTRTPGQTIGDLNNSEWITPGSIRRLLFLHANRVNPHPLQVLPMGVSGVEAAGALDASASDIGDATFDGARMQFIAAK